MGVYIQGVGKEELIDILRYENVFDVLDVSAFIEVEEPQKVFEEDFND